jgi:hypothetical protein
MSPVARNVRTAVIGFREGSNRPDWVRAGFKEVEGSTRIRFGAVDKINSIISWNKVPPVDVSGLERGFLLATGSLKSPKMMGAGQRIALHVVQVCAVR